MTTNTGFTGKGVVFQIGDDASPELFVTVANVAAISLNGRAVEEVDFTHLDTTGRYREFQAGFIDPGNVGLTLHFDPVSASHINIETLLGSGQSFNWKIVFTGAGKAKQMLGTGFVSANDISVTVSDPVSAEVTIRCSGPISLATPS